MIKKIILTIIMLIMFSTSAFAFKTHYTERNTDSYKFVYRVAKDIYISSKKKDSPLICALKAIQLCTVPFCGASTGITDVEIHEMAEMLEEDLRNNK